MDITRDPVEIYGTVEHEAWLIQMEATDFEPSPHEMAIEQGWDVGYADDEEEGQPDPVVLGPDHGPWPWEQEGDLPF